MSKIIKYFKELSNVPHCSGDTLRLKEFLIAFAKDRGYNTEIDNSDNILISKGKPKISLQAHYDMVCMGDAPNIEIYEDNGWLKAKNSSLGADNGIAIAMMMELMDKNKECEFILTNDEEIGLIGAKALNLDIKSKYMLNLDSEDEAEVYIGCAGGADIKAFKNYSKLGTGALAPAFGEAKAITSDEFDKICNKNIYEISINDLVGGHSGVDIDKDIPSAIKLLTKYIIDNNALIISFSGGERRNSIPANAKAIVYIPKKPKDDKLVKIKEIFGDFEVCEDMEFIKILDELKHGVIEHNHKLNIPQNSINLAIVEFKNNNAMIEISLRSMSDNELKIIIDDNINLFKNSGYSYKIEDEYPSWQPIENSLTKIVNNKMKKQFSKSKFTAIHAGLECGVISNRYPHIKFSSIGPNIKYPHSTREMVEINSVERTFNVVCDVIDEINL